MGKVQERQAIAAMIVDFLAEDGASPFCGRIKYPGEEWEVDDATTSPDSSSFQLGIIKE